MSEKRGGLLAGLLGTGALALSYSIAVEPYRIAIVRVEISLTRLPKAFDGYTVLQM